MRRRSMTAAARVTAPAAGVSAATTAGMRLSKHWTGRQDGSEDTDRKTRNFTHGFLRSRMDSGANSKDTRIATRLDRKGAPRGGEGLLMP
jgi:hypothetical protein